MTVCSGDGEQFCWCADIETMGALLDDAVLRHTGRSIGALASEAVANDVFAELAAMESRG